MTLIPALTTSPPMLVFVANGVELCRLSAALAPELYVCQYLSLYDITAPTSLMTYRIKRICHRVPLISQPPPGTTFPLQHWETIIDLAPAEDALGQALHRYLTHETGETPCP